MKYSPKIMGILNITPDSFYDGNPNLTTNQLSDKLKSIYSADIIDIGCESSRPGSDSISSSEEIKRLDMVLPLVVDMKDKIFSIDTRKYKVAKHAVNYGFKIINDISAGANDEKIFSLTSDNDISIILMHMLETPKTMQNNPKYDNLIDNIVNFFEERIKVAKGYGISDDNIIIDPGIGFGKSLENNIEIIKNIKTFKKLGFKLLLGHSRKQFLQYNNDTPSERMSASIGVSAYAAMNGVDILRVHDVQETISMLNTFMKVTQ